MVGHDRLWPAMAGHGLRVVTLAPWWYCGIQVRIKNKIDAVIASDNDSSFVTYKVAKKLQKAIPDDIAVIGYTSELIAGYLIPELTTINQHSFTMGKTAAKLLLDQLEAKNNTHQTFIINSTLSKRNSS